MTTQQTMSTCVREASCSEGCNRVVVESLSDYLAHGGKLSPPILNDAMPFSLVEYIYLDSDRLQPTIEEFLGEYTDEEEVNLPDLIFQKLERLFLEKDRRSVKFSVPLVYGKLGTGVTRAGKEVMELASCDYDAHPIYINMKDFKNLKDRESGGVSAPKLIAKCILDGCTPANVEVTFANPYDAIDIAFKELGTENITLQVDNYEANVELSKEILDFCCDYFTSRETFTIAPLLTGHNVIHPTCLGLQKGQTNVYFVSGVNSVEMYYEFVGPMRMNLSDNENSLFQDMMAKFGDRPRLFQILKEFLLNDEWGNKVLKKLQSLDLRMTKTDARKLTMQVLKQYKNMYAEELAKVCAAAKK